MQEAIVPAAPPEKRLNNFMRLADIVRVVEDMAADPPRVSVDATAAVLGCLENAPPRILFVRF